MKPKPLSKNALCTLRVLRERSLVGGDFFYGDAYIERSPAMTRGIAELLKRGVLYLECQIYRQSVRGAKVKT